MSSDDSHDPDALIAGVLRDARRPEPPTAQARERIRAAVHAQWRASLESSREVSMPPPPTSTSPAPTAAVGEVAPAATWRARGPLALAAGLAALIVSGALAWQQSSRVVGGVTTFARVEVVKGPVVIESPRRLGLFGARRSTPAAGEPVTVRQVVSTGATGAVLLRLGEGLTLRLAASSRLAVATAGEVALEVGTAYVDADPRFGASSLVVTTPLGRVRHLGTQYSISATANRLEVAVREGRVQLTGSPARDPLRVQAGEALRVESSGAVARTTVRPDDGRWRWLAGVPVPFDFDGATLPTFLDWYSRETGHSVSFADAAGAARARTVTLRGSILGLSPDEALQVVVASSGLATTRDGSARVLEFR